MTTLAVFGALFVGILATFAVIFVMIYVINNCSPIVSVLAVAACMAAGVTAIWAIHDSRKHDQPQQPQPSCQPATIKP